METHGEWVSTRIHIWFRVLLSRSKLRCSNQLKRSFPREQAQRGLILQSGPQMLVEDMETIPEVL